MTTDDTRPCHAPDKPGMYLLRCGGTMPIHRVMKLWSCPSGAYFWYDSGAYLTVDKPYPHDIIGPAIEPAAMTDEAVVARFNELVAAGRIEMQSEMYCPDWVAESCDAVYRLKTTTPLAPLPALPSNASPELVAEYAELAKRHGREVR